MLTSAAVAAPCRTAASIVATTSVSIAAVAVSTAAVPTISAAAAAGSGLSTPDTFGTGIRYQRVAARAAPGSAIPVVTIYPVTGATPPGSAIAIAAAAAAGICARDKSALRHASPPLRARSTPRCVLCLLYVGQVTVETNTTWLPPPP